MIGRFGGEAKEIAAQRVLYKKSHLSGGVMGGWYKGHRRPSRVLSHKIRGQAIALMLDSSFSELLGSLAQDAFLQSFDLNTSIWMP